MPLFEFFRNLFGQNEKTQSNPNSLTELSPHRDSFRNPIWQNDDEDDENYDFRQPKVHTHFRVFSDPLEITRFFESEIDHVMKQFFSGFGNTSEFSFPDQKFFGATPLPEQQDPTDLRRQVLKPGYEHSNSPNHKKFDTDLDGHITPHEFSQFLGRNEINPNFHQTPSSNFVHKSVKRYIRQSDGTVERTEIIRDNQGNEEKKVSRQLGDKTHIVVIKKDKDGIETKTEDIINMDEDELKKFNEKWSTSERGIEESKEHPSNAFPWHKFFGPNYKL